jgi:peptide-methionine (S)-S-oxide reductase
MATDERAAFDAAVDAIDRGDADGLRHLLAEHPGLADYRRPGGEGYFADPYLLWFVAENPIRHEWMPPQIVEVTRVLLAAIAQEPTYQEQVDYALGLVASGRVPREAGFQGDLIDCLVDAGARPDAAVLASAAHLERAAVTRLAERGATPSVLIAATIGETADVTRLAPSASPTERQAALMVAACLGRADVIAALVAAGADATAFGPQGAHAHSTPLHQAALAGHEAAVWALVDAGAPLDARDRMHQNTPAGWAKYGGHADLAEALQRAS